MSFSYPHARRSDPPTSREAVDSINVTAQAVTVLFQYRKRDLIDYDAYRLAGFPEYARNGQRCSDLRHAGYIERTGKRGLTPTGRAGYVCRITPAGLAYLRLKEVDFL